MDFCETLWRRVRPYGEYGDNNFDWLELASRLRRSPAGLGHQTNNWRVASEQIIGTVDISRENTNLDDAANRNGIQEGAGFEQLKRILLIVIKEFEREFNIPLVEMSDYTLQTILNRYTNGNIF